MHMDSYDSDVDVAEVIPEMPQLPSAPFDLWVSKLQDVPAFPIVAVMEATVITAVANVMEQDTKDCCSC
ncbi:uncharacterized protein PHACADRAFT_265632 [Phanerochaete carnosa HHB-10118-sp]|uniref:Uncharacterized protein n=1 Tax=Phanerochaete carnosa (strain HHB-10118-sp) TaxID=650164 RepID=K5UJZ1_PHACS|nr:uncharacterized protein PHACADRAFT_265632 [Phanerochaete carnosa HHB-10118-sp]EKM49881.1 hypothetical protein PHACADRAFT_265632 [Phanerochaete carnosa HHB-10118-sp]